MRLVPFLSLLPGLALAQGLPLKSGASSDLATVDTNKNLRVTEGASTRASYKCTATGLVATAAYNMTVEAGASQGFKLAGWCVGIPNATAAALVTVNVNRRITVASSGGTVAPNESTTTPSMSKMDPADGNFPGICRVTGTLGTIGPLLDGQGFQVGELGAGAADPNGQVFCKWYGLNEGKMPVVLAGVTNGISITVTAPGAGALAAGSITTFLIAE